MLPLRVFMGKGEGEKCFLSARSRGRGKAGNARSSRESFPDGMYFKADAHQMFVIQKGATVEEKGRFLHIVVNPFKVELLELGPVGEDGDCVSARAGVVGRVGNGDKTRKP